jgi:hypothetical protein
MTLPRSSCAPSGRLGELLASTPFQNGGDAARARSQHAIEVRPRLRDLGISKSQPSRWQALAAAPDPVFDDYIATTREQGPPLPRRHLHKARERGRRESIRACRSLCSRSSRASGWRVYDWRTCEAKLNALPQFITEIDGLDIHFIHARSQHEDALPLVVIDGWPDSIVEQLKIIDRLTNPAAHGASAADASMW